MSNKVNDLSKMIALWKELHINKCVFTFDCGGDSMRDTEFALYNSKQESVDCAELTVYFENAIYDEVDFYVNSDGVYMGESGEVQIQLEDGEDGGYFLYNKSSIEHYSENFTGVLDFELTDVEHDLIKSHISNINGGTDEDTTINYISDFILTDEQEEMIEDLAKRMDESCRSAKLEDAEGEYDESYRFTTNGNDSEEMLTELTLIEIFNDEKNKNICQIKLFVSQRYYVEKEGE